MSTPASKTATAPPSGDSEYPHRYNATLANAIELKWQARWEADGTFIAPNPGDAKFIASKPKFFCLDMFPYPSGAGLHVGHPEGYTATDIISRYKRHAGFNVLHPMGWDAFGLPAEQYAIQTGVHPAVTTRKSIDNFRRQLKRFGFCYDWSREFATIDPDYYKWTQWIFLRIYNAYYDREQDRARPISELIETLDSGKAAPGGGSAPNEWKSMNERERRAFIDNQRLAYIGEQVVNWCPKLGTALANEEVIDGKSERGGYPVFRKPLKQWMFRITAYAERLLRDLDLVKWPESTRVQQTEWIGRSEGAEIDFEIQKSEVGGQRPAIRVFTTRPDTVFGATFMVVAPEHPLVEAILQTGGTGVPPVESQHGQNARATDLNALREYVTSARNRSDVDRMAETKDKSGMFTGVYAINPAIDPENPLWVNQHRIPIWIADYVLMGYGHGAIMAVPGHDQRDFEFAREFNLPIVQVVAPDAPKPTDSNPWASSDTRTWERAFEGEGASVNSANAEVSLNGLPTPEAKQTIIEWLEKSAKGTRKINYKLRDWLFSRQRYWGEPFPIVFDEQGNHYPIDESHLPVTLPDMADYQPIESNDPQPLLAKATQWINTTAGAAGVSPQLLPPTTKVKRETNTMPGWAGSCWYYLRYCDPRNSQRFVGRDAERYWMVSLKNGTDARKAEGWPSLGFTGFDASIHHSGGVDLYVGGAEHAVLHLLYARFWHKALFDLGEVSTPEPFGRLFHQGLITSWAYRNEEGRLLPKDQTALLVWTNFDPRVNELNDSDLAWSDELGDAIPQVSPPLVKQLSEEAREGLGMEGNCRIEIETNQVAYEIVAKMSKSLKNVQNPDDVIAEFGADTFRLYEMYMGPLEASKPWNPRDIAGCFRFLQRAWRLVVDEQIGQLRLASSRQDAIEKQLHRTIAKVASDIERLSLNTAIAAMIEFVNAATATAGLTRDQLERFAVMLSPFAPHMAEELWMLLGHDSSIADAAWPQVDQAMLRDDQIEMPVQIMGKVRGKITVPADADTASVEKLALADAKIAQLIEGKTVRKVVVVPGKIINIVAN